MSATSPQNCSLCSSPVYQQAVKDHLHLFCCTGCHAVYHILASQGNLKNFSSQPLFKQAVKYGLISNPHLLSQLRTQTATAETHKVYFEVIDMWCPSCAEVIHLVLRQQKGVVTADVDFTTDVGRIEYNPQEISEETLFKAIRSLGYTPQTFEAPERKTLNQKLLLRLAIAAFCSLNIMMFSYPVYASYFSYDDAGYSSLFAWLTLILSLPVLTYSAWPIFSRSWTALKVGILGMEILVTLGVSTAFGLSFYHLLTGNQHVYFDSLSVIIAFVLLGKWIESTTKFSAKESLFRISKTLPKRGRKQISPTEQEFVPLKDILRDDIIIAYAGEKIVLDGTVCDGNGHVNESVMTGESVPVSKTTGCDVLAGSIVQSGWLAIRVAKTSSETALHRIVEMIENNWNRPKPILRMVDIIAARFIPVILMIALLTGAVLWTLGFEEEALLRPISILLIACPCAIGIAAPLAESFLMQGLGSLGAIVRNRRILNTLGTETVFFFDKTGTVTEGHFSLLEGLEILSSLERRILKTLTTQSNHPISTAISDKLVEEVLPIKDAEVIVGKGIRGIILGSSYYLGSLSFLRSYGIEVKTPQTSANHVFFADSTHCMSTLVLGDRIKEGISSLLSQLHPSTTILLSGDHQETVKEVGRQCGFSKVYWERTPLEKLEIIEAYKNQGNTVCMVGDGMNDAPALTSADTGISVVSATDLSIEVSDILLTSQDLRVIPKLGSLALQGQRIIKQNFFWAFSYNCIGIGLAIFGYLSPLYSAFAMISSSAIVIFNSKRLSTTQE